MNTLHDVQIDEISLVDAPANEDCRIILFKRSTAVDRAYVALEAVKKALQATKPESEGDGLPATVAACDAQFKRLVEQFKGDPIKAMDSPEGKTIYRRRYELKAGLDRIEKEAKPDWADDVAALDSVKAADRFLAALVAAQVARTGEPRNAVYNAILRQPLGIAIYARRAELARAA